MKKKRFNILFMVGVYEKVIIYTAIKTASGESNEMQM